MGGEVGFTSTVGKGSTFWVEFPATQAIEQKVAAAEKHQDRLRDMDRSSNRAMVLYIEDNISNLDFLKEVVRRMGNVNFISAPTAELGLSLAEERQPDLILMDINLPGMDGYEAMKALGSNDRTKDIPVIAVSAAAMKSDIEKGASAGFEGYLSKPFNVSEIIETIDRYLNADGS